MSLHQYNNNNKAKKIQICHHWKITIQHTAYNINVCVNGIDRVLTFLAELIEVTVRSNDKRIYSVVGREKVDKNVWIKSNRLELIRPTTLELILQYSYVYICMQACIN